MAKTLSFFARGTDLVQDIDAMEAGVRRYIGRRSIDKDGKPTSVISLVAGWDVSKEPSVVPYHYDYVKAAKDGCLWPADKETADACGVPFDPKFGAESSPDEKKKGDK